MKTGGGLPKAIDVAAALIFREGKLLITQRRSGDHLEGLWEFPGGKVEFDETFEDCLRREIREELDLEIEVRELLEDLTHTYPEKTVRLRFYRSIWLSGEAKPIGCAACAWITRAELGSYQFPAADARLLHILESSEGIWEESDSDAGLGAGEPSIT